MKKVGLLAGIVCSVALLAPMTQAAQEYVTSRNVVGYHNITIEPGLNLVAFPFQKIPVSTGVITAHDAHNQITVEGVDFEAVLGDYDEPGESTFYVEITTDAFEGRHFYVAAKDGNTLTLDLPAEADSDLKANDLFRAGYKVVAANRIRDLFGEPESPALSGGRSADAADSILRYRNGWQGPIYYRTSPPNANNWVRGVTPVNNEVIDRDEGLFVRIRQAGDVNLTIVGEVSQNDQQIVLEQGLNLVGGLSVIPERINDHEMEIHTLTGGRSGDVADAILEWGPTGWMGPLYFRTSPPNANRWVRGVSPVDFEFSPTQGYFIRVRHEPKGTWRRGHPFVNVE